MYTVSLSTEVDQTLLCHCSITNEARATAFDQSADDLRGSTPAVHIREPQGKSQHGA